MGKFTKLRPAFAALGLLLTAVSARAQSTSDLDALLQTPSQPPYQWFASTDKKHENEDYVWLKPGETKRIPLAAGQLERLWSTSLYPDKTDIVLEVGPNQRLPLLSGGVAEVGVYDNKAYTFMPGSPLDPGAKLKAGAALVATNRFTEPSKWFYQVSVRPISPRPLPELPKVQDIAFTRLGEMSIGAGEEKSLQVWNEPGLIYEFQVSKVEGPKTLFKDLHLRAAWEDKVAVDASLLGLAGQLAGDGLVQNAVSDFDGSALTLKWPMPFTKAQLWLKNTGTAAVKIEPSIRIRRYGQEPSPYRFCAIERNQLTEKDKPVDIVDVTGSGSFAGLAVSIKPTAEANARTFAYLEGNETIEADGTMYEGTGNEDFFSSSWYFPDKPFYLPYQGAVFKQQSPPSAAAYRLMVQDGIPFKKSLHFTFEHGRKNNRPGLDWTWVAFWYQKSPPGLEGTVPAPSGAAPSPGGNAVLDTKLPLWWAPVGGIVVGVLLYLSKRRRRAAQRGR